MAQRGKKPIPKTQREISISQQEPYVNPDTGETRGNPNDNANLNNRGKQTSFRNDDVGRKCVSEWANQCMDWCYQKLYKGKYADQKYLDYWPNKYDNLKTKNMETLWSWIPKNLNKFRSMPLIRKDAIENEEQIDRYELGQAIGRGQFALVRTARFVEGGKKISKRI